MTAGRRRGFTLIELLVVVVIIGLLIALLLPAIVKAICAARQGAAEHLIDNLAQATKAYEFDYAVYPQGDGSGSEELANKLSSNGPRKMAYFEFTDGMRTTSKFAGDILNPVWSSDGGSQGIIHYRNNVAAGAGGGSGGGGGPAVRNTKSFDMWCAGCNYDTGNPASVYEVNNWE
jgi:prepilin-type N-terminal cleavage/methylation domain-containing protein